MQNIVKNPSILNHNSFDLQQENLRLQEVIFDLSLQIKSQQENLASKDSQIEKQSLEIENKNLEIENKDSKIKNKDFEIAYYRKLIFGRRSEKAKYLTIDEKQLSLFDIIERHGSKDEEESESKLTSDLQEILKERKRLKVLEKQYKDISSRKKGRKSFRDSNPNAQVEIKEIDIAEHEKKCHCGSCLTKIGEETSETIEYIPATIKIIEHVRFKYACKNCCENIKIAPKASKLFDRSVASSSLVSHILTSKFEDHIPFYRQSKIFKRDGIKIEDKLMGNWHFKSSNIFAPLLMLLKDEISNSNYIAIDETTVTSIDKSKTNQPYMWVYQSKSPDKKLLYYDFCLDRSSKNPQLILQSDHQCYIQTDGYSGYNFLSNRGNITRLGCMAHARRKFSDIATLIKITSTNKNDIICHHILNKINRLYLIEERIKVEKITNGKKIYSIRQNESKPILKELYSYINQKEKITLSGSPIHKALTYFINQYKYLKNYLKDGMLDIDNNRTEGAIKPFAVGRKNWMFVGDEQGGAAAGTIYSLIESAKLNNLHTRKYLQYLLDNIKEDMKTEQLKELLPHRIDPELIQNWG